MFFFHKTDILIQLLLMQYEKSLYLLLCDIVLVIIPGLFEPPVRTLRATIPENESHIFR